MLLLLLLLLLSLSGCRAGLSLQRLRLQGSIVSSILAELYAELVLTTRLPTTSSLSLCTPLFNHSRPTFFARILASATAASISSSCELRKGCTCAT